ncbi:hypothetical protein PPL_05550 [Heterostelium album PN500]|uniref:BSD domain-containing protein n=1 Tax=Heterostelium pallidum (strain ATCC 26659 / Pp 5 / PN500) TaxID=670386 RepID=D3BAH4_HETP5|nr:hypothetical protein PPL_05550 [Heterostelium album PN500]EFA81561.1 hypothetical protein PPL_05550 [Heterostelium album PN500]|eukprot:XP_020433678.1 hypothetical protein PPL_05550 [Heterostelium album PN500]
MIDGVGNNVIFSVCIIIITIVIVYYEQSKGEGIAIEFCFGGLLLNESLHYPQNEMSTTTTTTNGNGTSNHGVLKSTIGDKEEDDKDTSMITDTVVDKKDEIRSMWQMAFIHHFLTLFVKPLHVKTIYIDELENALIEPDEFKTYLTELFVPLLRPVAKPKSGGINPETWEGVLKHEVSKKSFDCFVESPYPEDSESFTSLSLVDRVLDREKQQAQQKQFLNNAGNTGLVIRQFRSPRLVELQIKKLEEERQEQERRKQRAENGKRGANSRDKDDDGEDEDDDEEDEDDDDEFDHHEMQHRILGLRPRKRQATNTTTTTTTTSNHSSNSNGPTQIQQTSSGRRIVQRQLDENGLPMLPRYPRNNRIIETDPVEEDQSEPSTNNSNKNSDEEITSESYLVMNFFRKLLDIPEVKPDDAREREELGITDELIAFVKNISKYPESFKDFPLQTLSNNTQFRLSSLQTRHVNKIITIVEPLNELRFKLCPLHMKDDVFWRIYFIHISKVTTQVFDTDDIHKKPSSSLDELDSQLDQITASAPNLMQYDQGLNEDEDNYYSDNTYIDIQRKEKGLDADKEAEVPNSDLIALKNKILALDQTIEKRKQQLIQQQQQQQLQQQPNNQQTSPTQQTVSPTQPTTKPSSPGFLDLDFFSSIIK